MKKTATVEEILNDHSPSVRALAEQARQLVKEAVPGVKETPQPAWHSINYHHPQSGYFLGLFPRREDLQIAFEWGALLPDPRGLLQGTGKQVRYYVVESEAGLDPAAVRALIEAALSLPDSRAARLAMLRAARA